MSAGGLPGMAGTKSKAPDPNAAAARSAAEKQVARNAVNAAFGVAPSMDNITRGALSTSSGSQLKWDPVTQQFSGNAALGILNPGGDYVTGLLGGKPRSINGHTDSSAYDSALAAYTKNATDAAANKTARESLYDTVRSDAFGAGKTSLDETRADAARNNKFALFAQGLNGGSQDVDENALLGRTYDHGVLDLGAKADLAKSTLQGNDETTRLGLLQSVDNGMSTSDALTSALNQMKSGADSAEASAKGTTLGDLFAASGLLYTKSNAARGSAAANSYLANLFPQGGAALSGSKNNGIVTPT